MPVLLEAKQIHIEFSDLEILVPKERHYTGPRSSGVHLSGVIKFVLQAAGLLTADDRTDIMPLCMVVGMAWEAWVVQLWPDLVWQPGEYTMDGIVGSPDGYTNQGYGGLVLEEIKATYMGRLERTETKGVIPKPRNVLTIRRWMLQLAGYCKMMGLTRARMHVLWVMGDYRGSGPQYFTYDIQFTQDEIDRVWNNMILPNVAGAIAEQH